MIVHFNFFSLCMSFVSSSILIILFVLMRRSRLVMQVCSLSGIILLFILCVIRLFVPIELPGAIIINLPDVYNPVYDFMRSEITIMGKWLLPVYGLLQIIWVAVAIALICYHIVNYILFSSFTNKLPKYERTDLNDIIKKVVQKDNTSIDIRLSKEIESPVSCGIFHKKIILPSRIYSDKDLYYILRHEFTHLNNGDLIIQFLTNILCALYWWNPFVYLLKINYIHYLELRCDYVVARNMTEEEKAEYLTSVLQIYKETNNKPGSRGNNRLRERFQYVKDYKEIKWGKYISSALLIGFFCVSYVFIFQSHYEPNDITLDIHKEHGAIEIDPKDCYILQNDDGSYSLVTPYGIESISPDDASFLQDDFEIKKSLQQ